MIRSMFQEPVFGIVLTMTCYLIARRIAHATRSPLANPVIVASVLCLAVLLGFGIPIADYQMGGAVVMMLIFPATICLAVMVYEHRAHLMKNLLPALVGCTVGAVASIASVRFFGRLFGLSEILIRSQLAKSVTTAIAIDLAPTIQGDLSLAVVSVMITGISGVLIGPLLLTLFKVTDPVLQGIAMGTSSHVIGTSRAMEMGPIQGAMSSIALFITGLMTATVLLIQYS